MHVIAYLREGAVVPDVPVVGEAVADVAQTAALDVLLDGVERLLLGGLHLCVRPAGDLDDHVEDAIVLVGEERDVVEGRDDLAALLDEDTVLCGSLSDEVSRQGVPAKRLTEGVGRADEASSVRWVHREVSCGV